MALNIGNRRFGQGYGYPYSYSEEFVMKRSLAAIVIVCFSFVFACNLVAQTRGAQRTRVVMNGTGRADLNSTLIDLDRISQATQNDILNLHVEKWKGGW